MIVFYTLAGLLALATALVMVLPLIARGGASDIIGARDTQLYRDQLDEVERDLARGTINASEAEGTRAEVSRRLIAAAGRSDTGEAYSPAPRGRTRLLAGFALVGTPALAAVIYLGIGVPGQPDLPLAKRAAIEAAMAKAAPRPSQVEAEAEAAIMTDPSPPLTEEQQNYAALMERLEAMIEKRPDDTRGLELLATHYMGLQRYAESWRAYERLIAVLGDKAGADIYAAMAEGMVLAAGGYVSPEAERAIGEALARDGSLVIARYYAGLLMAQSGNLVEAITIWEKLQADTPEDAPWRNFLDGMLAEAKVLHGGVRGPSAADIASAESVSPEDIVGMVERLEERLTSKGGPPEEWLRLMNAYKQLDRRDDAVRVTQLGIAAFGNRAEAGFLREQALLMGLIDE